MDFWNWFSGVLSREEEEEEEEDTLSELVPDEEGF